MSVIIPKFVIIKKTDLWIGVFPSLSFAGFANACSCRFHGESNIVPNTLNLALHVGDDKDMVLKNRERFGKAIGINPKKFTTCAQVHGSKVTKVTKEMVGSGATCFTDTIPDTDALITILKDVPLLMFYADCTPVMLADKRTGAIGIVHAGWRGTVANIVKKTVEAMHKNFGTNPEDLLATVGPCIGQCCYEVDDVVHDWVAPGYSQFFKAEVDKPGRYFMDLQGYNEKQLLDSGVLPENISLADTCTSDNNELFCSYRAENGETGRMGVCICNPSKK